MPISSIPRMTNPASARKTKARSPFLLVFLSTLLAVYIALISYWLITSDTNEDLAANAAAQLQTSIDTRHQD